MATPIKPPLPALPRVALAEAIAARNEIQRQLGAARDAFDQAQRSQWAAANRLDALRKARDEAAAAQDLGGAVHRERRGGGAMRRGRSGTASKPRRY